MKRPHLKKIPFNRKTKIATVLILIALLIIGLAAPGNKTKPTNASTSYTNSKTAGSSNAGNPITLAPQDTLSQWKADPDYQNPLTGISYDQLFRNIDSYTGKFVHYEGQVIQVLGNSGDWNIRVNITQQGDPPYTYWQDPIFIYSYSPDRVIENDLIEFTGQVNGVITYKSVLGGDITVPSLTIYEQQVVGRSE